MSFEELDVNAAFVAPIGTIADEGYTGLTCWQRSYMVEPGRLE